MAETPGLEGASFRKIAELICNECDVIADWDSIEGHPSNSRLTLRHPYNDKKIEVIFSTEDIADTDSESFRTVAMALLEKCLKEFPPRSRRTH